ncbi:PLAC8-domain-containing protein [Aspergillus steynii IBT 23096]|uniref:PLAC8-domain-containing protein n=1 Tax=Aspergillus steynii IBT 23096 TaxID=1392250 RepID=A0A2I2G071_9EURO|nr:PLAC8-domain-containing protein [Aspergillus steynii IBT 23096]PLB46226.1 PLAC8-domain-containing protein [Aspergillus steynii IBT 23096]
MSAFEPRDWSFSLFACFSPIGICLRSWLCPCVQYGKTQARLKDPYRSSYSCCNSDCVIWTISNLLCCCGCVQFCKRRAMASQLNIKSACCGDCVAACFCPCCALVQEGKEADRCYHHVEPGGKGELSGSIED